MEILEQEKSISGQLINFYRTRNSIHFQLSKMLSSSPGVIGFVRFYYLSINYTCSSNQSQMNSPNPIIDEKSSSCIQFKRCIDSLQMFLTSLETGKQIDKYEKVRKSSCCTITSNPLHHYNIKCRYLGVELCENEIINFYYQIDFTFSTASSHS